MTKRELGPVLSSLDHIMAEIQRIDLKLKFRVESLSRENASDNDGQLGGLCITEKEVQNILNPANEDEMSGQKKTARRASTDMVARLEKANAERKKEALDKGLSLRLDNLEKLFGLSRFELDVLLICLLPEIDLKYQRLFAYLQDDVTKKNPAVNLILHLLCDSVESRLKASEFFSEESPLRAHQLIHLQDDPVSKPSPLPAKYVRVDERIISYLLETGSVDNRLSEIAVLVNPKIELQNMVLEPEIKSRLQKLSGQFSKQGLLGCLWGSDRARQQSMAEAVCHEIGIPLLRIDINDFMSADIPDADLIPLIFREGLLQNAALFLSGFETLLSEDKASRLLYKRVIGELRDYPLWAFLSSEKDWQPKGIFGGKPCFNVEVDTASYAERTQTWSRFNEGQAVFAPGIDLTDIAGKFKFTSGQIADAVTMAQNLARWRDPDKGVITAEDLYTACRRQSRETLSSLARKIQPVYRWEDIILPPDQVNQLREIANYVAHYHTVYSEWGFGRKISTGKGLNVLFAGPSGTGKTMAAEVIANDLGIDLYKIDLSSIVSKYIGETEKNLDRIFKEAETSNAILFFDEADALFGKRSEVRDSHDRYANIEVAYLLQKMDDYEGIVILATNLRKNMDDAFARRMHYTLEFPVPEEADRYRIWQNIFPKEAPLSKTLDLKFMAKQFKISGGNIKNIALNAAFLATMNGGVINTEHLIQATRREYQKIGKLCTEGDFGKYFELVKN